MSAAPFVNSYPTLFGCAPGGGGKVVVVGVPYDRGTDNHPGCANAPNTLRMLSRPEERIARADLFDLASGRPLFAGKDLSDIGDVRHRLHQRDDISYLDFVAQAIRVVAQEKKRPLLLGGDHLVTLSALRGLSRAGHSFQVVQIDAHHDYASTPTVMATHATFMSFVASEELAAQVLQIGVRGFSSFVPEAPRRIKGIALEQLRASLIPGMPVYLTVDTDGFDPLLLPAVSYPIPGGLRLDAISEVLAAFRDARTPLIGADWMEYNPTFDGMNHITGVHIVSGLIPIIQAMIDDTP